MPISITSSHGMMCPICTQRANAVVIGVIPVRVVHDDSTCTARRLPVCRWACWTVWLSAAGEPESR